MVTEAIPRPWKVFIQAVVTQDVEVTLTPGHCKTRSDSLEIAVSQFEEEHRRDDFEILSVTISRNGE